MCSIGEHVGGECSTVLQRNTEFSKEELKLLKLRSGRSIIRNVCSSHRLLYLALYESKQTVCCNPLPNRHLSGPAKGTRTISLSLYRKSKGTFNLIPGKKLCKTCMSNILTVLGEAEEIESSQTFEVTPENSQPVEESPQQDVAGTPNAALLSPAVRRRTRPTLPLPAGSPHSSKILSASAVSSLGYVPPGEHLDTLNDFLAKIRSSTLDKNKLKFQPHYGSNMLEEIQTALHALLQANSGNNIVELPASQEISDFKELLNMLKEKFKAASGISEKVLILSVLPPTWSIGKIEAEFGPLGASNYIIRKTKALVQEQGVLVKVNHRLGRPVGEDTVKLVTESYELDEISSKLMPGCKDYVSVRENGVRVQKQKRLLLSNLSSLFEEYMNTHGDDNPIGFSKFAQLRPKHCVLAGSAGTHSVCVCVYHENVNLLFEGARLKVNSAGDDIPLKDFKDCCKQLVCEDSKPECYLRECQNCPSPDHLKERILHLLDENMMESVTYRGWFKVGGRYHLEKVVKPVEEFVDIFMQSLLRLLPHHFTAKQQSAYYKKAKEDLKEGEALVICDFAENYSCVMQNEVQGYHWTNEQITLHPFVAYFRDQHEMKKVCYVAISDCRKHVTASFHAFQKKFIPFLEKKLEESRVTCTKILYFSDGSSAQYKNRKNVKNVCLHQKDFPGVNAEWHYFASCHGKGPCDGVGGTVKRYAARASLQGKIIRNAKEMCDWAKDSLPNIKVELFTVEEVEEIINQQTERAKDVLVLNNITSFHAILPKSDSEVYVKRYSESCKTILMHLCKRRVLVNWPLLDKFALVVKGNKWCLAQIVKKMEETKNLDVKFLCPAGRAKTYRFPQKEDLATIPWKDVLAVTTPILKKLYSIPAADKNIADRELKLYQELRGAGVMPDTEEDLDNPDPITSDEEAEEYDG